MSQFFSDCAEVELYREINLVSCHFKRLIQKWVHTVGRLLYQLLQDDTKAFKRFSIIDDFADCVKP